MEIAWFTTADQLRDWYKRHDENETELLLGFRKTGSGLPTITQPEAIDEALRHGWIDGVRANYDKVSYTIRFTPRKAGSTWSAVNIKRAGELIQEGSMTPAGLKAFEARREAKSGTYSYEQGDQALDAADEARLRANPKAWDFFQKQTKTYRKAVTWWIVSAKKPGTKAGRLTKVIELCESGRTVPAFTPRKAPV